MSEVRHEDKKLPENKEMGSARPAREELTEIMKAHLDLIEGGSSHFSKWSSVG